ncbi:hypothetical protein LINGRAHAP2_LOCUS5260, partial [Linum grandiflorum]
MANREGKHSPELVSGKVKLTTKRIRAELEFVSKLVKD